MNLERVLVQEGVAAPPEQLRRVLGDASRDGRDPVVALVESGVVVEDVLAEVLARTCGTVVVDLEGVAEPQHAPLEERLARQHLALPVGGIGSGRMRVAFVNPLSTAARTAVEEAVGVAVQPLVATVSGMRAGLERQYPIRAHQGEMISENTRRLVAPMEDLPSTDTAPLHRLERRATVEQRLEALLLALIEKGVLTRADYSAALERLMSDRADDAQ
ncbi:MAG: hypothetical protein RLO52_41110 [Sandaracinaceae bacterium]